MNRGLYPKSPRSRERDSANCKATGIAGDAIPQLKQDDHVRILLHNCSGLGPLSFDRELNEYSVTDNLNKLRLFCDSKQVDLVGLTETNTDWRTVDPECQMWKMARAWFPASRTIVSNNQRVPATDHKQWGGTAMLCMQDLCAFENGKLRCRDFRGLGRWSSMSFAGKMNTTVTFITAYCPVNNAYGLQSTSTKQRVYINKHLGQHREEHPDYIPPTADTPRKLFGHDLKTTILKLQSLGHQVWVMGDFNAEYPELRTWMANLGLVDMIGQRHGCDSLPITCKKSNKFPIDAIFGPSHMAAFRCGYLKFGTLGGDHRGLWLDIPKRALFGCKIPTQVPAILRRLTLEDPRVVEKYNECLEKELKELNIYSRTMAIYRNATFPLSQELALAYENLDADIVRCQESAERKCRKVHTGKYYSSPILKNAYNTLDYWRKRHEYLQGNRKTVSARDLINIQKRLGIQYEVLSLSQVKVKIQQAVQNLKEIKKNSKDLHISHRLSLANALAQRGNISAATHIRMRLKREEQRDVARSARYMLNKISSGATTKVQITDATGTKSEYTDKADVERLIIQENERKYHQTEGGTELLNQEFLDKLGQYGEGPEVDNVLNGTFEYPDNTSPATKEFLQHCKRVDQLPPPDSSNVRASFLAYIKAWKLRKEKTNSANQHMGHYKAGIQNDYICTVLYMRSEIPVVSGYSPKRWRECVDLMILKKAMNFELSKQRTLGLLDTELNQCNKRLQREAIKVALKTDSIAPEQYSRPGRDCRDHALNRRLTLDARQYERQCFSLAMSDLAGCYDRIVHTAAALALLRLGLKKTTIFAMFDSIQRMTHRVRTAYGDSDITYGGDSYANWKNAPQGVLQGNAAGPVIWAILSSVIFDILRKKGFCDKFCMCLSRELFELVGFAFVDDADLIQSGADADEVLEKTQLLLDEWRDLMAVTGGAIETKKSYFYIIDYKKQKGRWRAYDPDIGDAELNVLDKDGNRRPLDRLPCGKAAEMLGVWMAMNGDKSKQIEILQQKVLEWTNLVRVGTCTQEVIWHTFQITITKQIEYILLSHTFTEKECTKIFAPAIKLACRKSGYSSTLRRIFRQTSSAYFGAGAMNIFQQSGVLKISALVMHSWKESPTQSLLKHNIELFVLEAGLFGPVWHLPTLKKALTWCSPHSWLYHTAVFLVKNDIQICPKHFELKAKRRGDKAIMDVMHRLHFTSNELRKINEVRMLHGVVTLSDLTTADGRRLDPVFLHRSAFEGDRNTYKWPTKHDVTPSEFKVWIQAMHILFPQGINVNHPLYQWELESTTSWLDHWNWFRSTDGSKLFYREDDSWFSYNQYQNSRSRFATEFSAATRPDHNLVERVTVEYDGDFTHVTRSSNRFMVQAETRETMRLGRHTIYRPTIPYLFQFIKMSDNIDTLLYDISQGTALCVGDGSYFEFRDICTCGWIICSSDGSQWIKGGGYIPGLEKDLNSYRGELGSLVGIVNCIEALAPLIPQNQAAITVASDNDSAVDCLWLQKYHLKASTTSLDLISSLIDLWESVPFSPIPTKVKGHADQLHRPLTFLEHLNCIVDEYAKEIATYYFTADPPTDFSRSVGLSTIQINDFHVTSNIVPAISSVLDKKTVCEYWSGITGVSSRILQHEIGWTSIRRARKERSFKQNRFITKFIANDLPTGENLERRQHSNTNLCPCCKRVEETNVHLLTCPATKDFRSTLLTELNTFLTSLQTATTLQQFIMSGITSWLDDPDNGIIPYNIPLEFLPVATKQNDIGWYSTLLGFLHQDVIRYQHLHYLRLSSRRTGTAWAKHLISKLWNFTYQLWAERNRLLHHTDTNDEFRGLEALELSIKIELDRGLRSLPRSIYSHHFQLDPDTLQDLSTETKKEWLLLIRSAREAHMDAPIDAFSNNDILREWIGLDPIGRT